MRYHKYMIILGISVLMLLGILGVRISWGQHSQEGGVLAMSNETPERIEVFDAQKNALVEVDRVQKTDEEWKAVLDQKVFNILREKGTERPFTGEYNHYKANGIYICAACGNHLFSSHDKFDSGTGWPSFTRAIHKNNVLLKEDRGLFLSRTEVLCVRCGGHLGHVFDDGPPPMGKRYCINSLALKFLPLEHR